MRLLLKKRTKTMLMLLGIFSAFALVGCATQPGTYGAALPGFISGLWHGAISPLSLIGGFFSDVRIYKYPNSGWSYDFGFMVAWFFWAAGASEATN